MAWGARKCDIALAIPTVGTVYMEWAVNLAGIFRESPPNTFVVLAPEPQIDIAREKLAEIALNMNAKYIFYLDSDIIVQHDVINKLKKHMDKYPIVSGLYVRRHNPPWNEMMLKHKDGYASIIDGNYEKGGLIECDAVGFGCVLIKTEILKEIEKPWFRWSEHTAMQGASEDFYFCRKARQTGFKIAVDTSVRCKHMGPFKWLVDNQYEYPLPGGVQLI